MSSTGTISLRTHRFARAFVAFVPVAFLFSACGSAPQCRPTTTVARRAAAADLQDTKNSSMLVATLRSRTLGLNHKPVRFLVRRKKDVVTGDYEVVEVGSGTTIPNGVVGFDLKKLPPAEFARDALGDRFDAVFDGDGLYCASRGAAPIDTVRTPAAPRLPTESSRIPAAVPPVEIPSVVGRAGDACAAPVLSFALNAPCTGVLPHRLDPHLP
jgi:hypothetical protein